ncbi:MAG: Beta-ketoacyl synthase [Chloroflexi bacterium]|nr:Beta-ketoacyl synthase [Chloroflexota bacterium]MDB5074221.1 Beta-ketoacyl synthase [Chloroflexota bacterium]
MRRVVVTGMGVISPLGIGVDATWNGLIEGRSGIRPITFFDPSLLRSRIAGEVEGFDPTAFDIDFKLAKRCDRFTQFALATSHEALAQAQLSIEPSFSERVGVIIGSGIGGLNTLMDQFTVLFQKGPERISPFFVTMLITDLAAGQISIKYGLKGPNFAISSACSTGAHAIGESVEIIRRGDADVMLAGGSEAPIVLIAMAAFANMRALSTRNDEPAKASRPFDAQRDGFVLSEGASTFVLEAEEFALARNAPILAEVVGYAATADAHHVTDPSPDGEGAARAMTLAIQRAGVCPEDIQYINAHGTSTFAGDRAETAAIKRVLGDAAYRVPISSTKGATGHMLGAGGTVEAAFCIKAMHSGIVPPTINYEFPDPECDLDYVPNVARRTGPLDITMSNSFGFGGHNVSLVLRRYQPNR